MQDRHQFISLSSILTLLSVYLKCSPAQSGGSWPTFACLQNWGNLKEIYQTWWICISSSFILYNVMEYHFDIQPLVIHHICKHTECQDWGGWFKLHSNNVMWCCGFSMAITKSIIIIIIIIFTLLTYNILYISHLKEISSSHRCHLHVPSTFWYLACMTFLKALFIKEPSACTKKYLLMKNVHLHM